MRLIIGLIILSLGCLSCNSNEAKPPKEAEAPKKSMPISEPKSATSSKPGKPLIQIENLLSNQGYINIPLNIVEQTSRDGYLINKIQAMSKNDTLELIVSLKEGVVEGTSEIKFITDGIIFESTGPKSDRLLTALAQKYKINSGKLTMDSKQVLTCVNLNNAAIDYQAGTPKFKVFLSDKNEVAELYVNFDFKKSTISLNEKDPQYRDALINIWKK